MKIMIINGPNMNLLGRRETDIYGEISFEQYLKRLRERFPQIIIDYFQSNIEGELVEAIQKSGFIYTGIILNAGGYTHTSVSLADAIRAISTPVVEVHISNIFAREAYRHSSLTAAHAVGTISGFGLDSYRLAIEYFLEKTKD
ncbi:MAG: 3-dehydroquinate dehydratase [Bacteroidetes bacterium]|nr:3-dehydroquinate dehydratase [Bacteroidota bacterium]